MSKVRYFLGVDCGKGYTKSQKILFESKVSRQKYLKVGQGKKGVYGVSVNGVHYTVGQGNHFTEYERELNENYVACLMTAIGLNFPNTKEVDLCLCVGLPLTDYINESSTLSVDMETKLLNKEFKVNIDGRDIKIIIRDFNVYPEGTYPIYAEKTSHCISVDVGMGTVNVGYFDEMGIENAKTYDGGMYGLYEELITLVNNKYKGADVSVETMTKYFGKNEMPIRQEKQDISFLKPYIDDYVRRLYGKIAKLFPIADVEEVFLMGGGAKPLLNSWKKVIPEIQIVEDAQTINSKAYHEFAQMMFEGED